MGTVLEYRPLVDGIGMYKGPLNGFPFFKDLFRKVAKTEGKIQKVLAHNSRDNVLLIPFTLMNLTIGGQPRVGE